MHTNKYVSIWCLSSSFFFFIFSSCWSCLPPPLCNLTTDTERSWEDYCFPFFLIVIAIAIYLLLLLPPRILVPSPPISFLRWNPMARMQNVEFRGQTTATARRASRLRSKALKFSSLQARTLAAAIRAAQPGRSRHQLWRLAGVPTEDRYQKVDGRERRIKDACLPWHLQDPPFWITGTWIPLIWATDQVECNPAVHS